MSYYSPWWGCLCLLPSSLALLSLQLQYYGCWWILFFPSGRSGQQRTIAAHITGLILKTQIALDSSLPAWVGADYRTSVSISSNHTNHYSTNDSVTDVHISPNTPTSFPSPWLFSSSLQLPLLSLSPSQLPSPSLTPSSFYYTCSPSPLRKIMNTVQVSLCHISVILAISKEITKHNNCSIFNPNKSFP